MRRRSGDVVGRFRLITLLLALLLPLLGLSAPGQVEVRTAVAIEFAPQSALQAEFPPCGQAWPFDRPHPEPPRASRPPVEGASVVAPPRARLDPSAWQPCTRTEWAALTGPALVEAIATSTRDCLSVLWTYDANTADVIAARNVEVVAAGIVAEASDPVANAGELRNLCLFFQIAFYHEFYQSGTDYGPVTEAAARDAIVTLGHRPELLTSLGGMPALRAQWAVSMDSTNSTVGCLGPVEDLLVRFDADPSLVLVYDEALAIYYCLFSLQRQIYTDYLHHGASSPWVGAVSTRFANVVRSYAVNVDPTPDRESLTNNAIWALGYFSYLDLPTAESGRSGTSDAYRLQPTYSGPWVWSIRTLELFYGATLDDGTVLDIDALRADVRAYALPSVVLLDQGSVVFETALSEVAVQRLYAATKEVAAQFFRKCTFLEPVPGDVHDVVTVAVYASRADYTRYQSFLFGTSTDNGGIYLEQLATLCTYDRTPAESIYTLEELVRHEYAHYLDARFNVTGTFGEPGTLYVGGRIDSYVEGLAEFAAGSTRVEGVLPRRKLVHIVETDVARMSVAEILAATYAQGFRFYAYGSLLFGYLAERRPDLFLSVFQAIRGNDPAVVDALESSLANDAALELAFSDWLDEQISRSHDSGSIFAEDVSTVLPPADLPGDNGAAVLAELTATLPGGTFATWEERYRHDGQLTLPTTGLTPGEQRVLFDERMDLALAALESRGPNFVSAVAWCGDIVYGPDSATAAFAIEGPFDPQQDPPVGSGGGGGCAGVTHAGGAGGGDPSLVLVLALLLAFAVAHRSRAARRPVVVGR